MAGFDLLVPDPADHLMAIGIAEPLQRAGDIPVIAEAVVAAVEPRAVKLFAPLKAMVAVPRDQRGLDPIRDGQALQLGEEPGAAVSPHEVDDLDAAVLIVVGEVGGIAAQALRIGLDLAVEDADTVAKILGAGLEIGFGDLDRDLGVGFLLGMVLDSSVLA